MELREIQEAVWSKNILDRKSSTSSVETLKESLNSLKIIESHLKIYQSAVSNDAELAEMLVILGEDIGDSLISLVSLANKLSIDLNVVMSERFNPKPYQDPRINLGLK